MKHDFTNSKVGDIVLSLKHGWVKIDEIREYEETVYQILTENSTYTIDGKEFIFDKFPSLFTEPPEEFKAGKRPCKFKIGERVLVCDNHNHNHRGYFLKFEEDGKYPYCITQDLAGWVEDKGYTKWKYCKRWTEDSK